MRVGLIMVVGGISVLALPTGARANFPEPADMLGLGALYEDAPGRFQVELTMVTEKLEMAGQTAWYLAPSTSVQAQVLAGWGAYARVENPAYERYQHADRDYESRRGNLELGAYHAWEPVRATGLAHILLVAGAGITAATAPEPLDREDPTFEDAFRPTDYPMRQRTGTTYFGRLDARLDFPAYFGQFYQLGVRADQLSGRRGGWRLDAAVGVRLAWRIHVVAGCTVSAMQRPPSLWTWTAAPQLGLQALLSRGFSLGVSYQHPFTQVSGTHDDVFLTAVLRF